MLVVLPDADDGLDAVERALATDGLEGKWSKMSNRKVRVSLPRFKLAGVAVELKGPLQKLGMVEAFDDQKANFSGMGIISDMVWIDKVMHKAFVEVNERGSEAAAATAVVVAAKDKDSGEDRDQPVSFTADHPFLYLIRDDRTGCILFLGRLVTPKG